MVKSQTKKKNTKAGSRPANKQAARKVALPRYLRPEGRRCAKHYAETVMDPFSTEAGACVPQLPCLESTKRRVFARGVGRVESEGFGGIVAATCLTSDDVCAHVTNGTNFPGIKKMANANCTNAYTNSELTSSDFASHKVQGRVVACGIRIRFTGRKYDMNGTCYALEEPAHLDTQNLTVEDLRQFDRVKTTPFNKDWTVVTWQPVLPKETSYAPDPYCAPYTGEAHSPLLILIECQGMPAGTSLPFEWEYVIHYEAIGSGARGKTPSHISPHEGAMATAALQQAPTTLFDDISNRKISAKVVADKMLDHGPSWIQTFNNSAQGVFRTAVGAVTSRAAASYMAGGLAALAA